MLRRLRILALLILAVLLLTACGRPSVGVRIAGSTSVQPLVEVLAEAYERNGGSRVATQGGGSTAGLQAVRSGVAALGAVSRRLTPREEAEGLRAQVIAYDLLVIAVHPENPLAELRRTDLRRLFAGEVRDWSELGGRTGPVHLVSREAGSGSREAFRELVGPVHPRAVIQGSAGAIRLAVMHDPQAVGYVSLGALHQGGLKPLAVDGLLPEDPGYPLLRPLSLVSAGPPTAEALAFLRFALGSDGQALIRAEGLLPPP